MLSDRRRSAVRPQSPCSRFAVLRSGAMLPLQIRSLAFCSFLVVACVLLVCEACLVSVSVRPERLSVSGSTRHAGHHSRCVQNCLLLLAAAAPALGVDGASCGKLRHRFEPLTQGSGVRALRADQRTPVLENGQMDEPHCTVVDCV